VTPPPRALPWCFASPKTAFTDIARPRLCLQARHRATPKGKASAKRKIIAEEAGNKRARVLQESTFESNSRPAVQQKTTGPQIGCIPWGAPRRARLLNARPAKRHTQRRTEAEEAGNSLQLYSFAGLREGDTRPVGPARPLPLRLLLVVCGLLLLVKTESTRRSRNRNRRRVGLRSFYLSGSGSHCWRTWRGCRLRGRKPKQHTALGLT
jgi:hypothetical protein